MQAALTSFFLFRRDLRLHDNTALIRALQESAVVHLCFIFDAKQVGEKNSYRSLHAIQFMTQALEEVSRELSTHGGILNFYYGETEQVLTDIFTTEKIDALYMNEDYTLFSRARDAAIAALCKKHGVECRTFADTLLHAPGVVMKDGGKPYTVFTPFYNKALSQPVTEPAKCPHKGYATKLLPGASANIDDVLKIESNPKIAVHGGRSHALKILKKIADFSVYAKTRDIPSLDGTTHLSAYHKFGCISARETYYAVRAVLGLEHALIRELYWRDFFTCIAFHFPHVFGHAFHRQYDRLPWSADQSLFTRWCEGRTGFPIVDAGMRELNETGFMHNRVRMIVASFLIKDLHIDWQWGERYFATKLVDYDPCVNNGSWQWSASTGCDAQPYFRIFNPWLQQKRYDEECVYIKKWIPELRDCSPAAIHAWEKVQKHDIDYPAPMCIHSTETQKTKDLYAKVAKSV